MPGAGRDCFEYSQEKAFPSMKVQDPKGMTLELDPGIRLQQQDLKMLLFLWTKPNPSPALSRATRGQ